MEQNHLTNDPQELLKSKQEADKQKQQFSSFIRNISEPSGADTGQVSPDQHREPDKQNNLKDTENRML